MKITARFLSLCILLTALSGCGGEAQPNNAGGSHSLKKGEPPTAVTTERLQMNSDLDHDGEQERLELRTIPLDKDGTLIYELRVVKQDGVLLWSEQAMDVHPGWNTICLRPVEGKDFLLRYHPTMYQGQCVYSYQLFSLDAAGNEVVQAQDALEFDVNFRLEGHSFPIEEIAAFLETMEEYLTGSTVLLNTDPGLAFTVGQPPRAKAWFLREYPEFPFDEQASLTENLRAYAKQNAA